MTSGLWVIGDKIPNHKSCQIKCDTNMMGYADVG